MNEFEFASRRIAQTFEAILGVRLALSPTPGLNALSTELDMASILRCYTSAATLLVLNEVLDTTSPETLNGFLASRASATTLVIVAHVGSVEPRPNTDGVLHIFDPELRELFGIAGLPRDQRKTAFRKLIIGKQPRAAVNPYNHVHPAADRMFFNRQSELEQALQPGLWKAIVGQRRIGKSSLARAVVSRLRNRPNPLRGDHQTPIALIDCGGLSYEYFWGELYDSIALSQRDRREGRRHALTDPVKRRYRRQDAFESVLSLMTYEYKHPWIILDEVSMFVSDDKAENWRFFSQLRGLCEKVRAELILVDYFPLADALEDDTFPFYETCAIIAPGSLPVADASRLVREPLEELGYTVDDELVGLIIGFAECEASRIQAICREVVLGVEPGSLIFPETAKHIINRMSPAFQMKLREIEDARQKVRKKFWQRAKEDLAAHPAVVIAGIIGALIGAIATILTVLLN